jgi:hypothetical protein
MLEYYLLFRSACVHKQFLVGFVCYLIFSFLCGTCVYHCLFSFLLVIVLSVLLFMDSDCLLGIFKLFLIQYNHSTLLFWKHIPSYVFSVKIKHIPSYVFSVAIKHIPSYVFSVKIKHIPSYVFSVKIKHILFRNACTKSRHYGFHSFPVVDWFCLFIYLWVLTFPL